MRYFYLSDTVSKNNFLKKLFILQNLLFLEKTPIKYAIIAILFLQFNNYRFCIFA